MFDRLMVIVGKIRGFGGDELDDHYVVKVMLEAFAPRNPTLVTLIREKKRFEEFFPNDVLGRILATYVGVESNIYVKRSLWVPKVLVANVEGPKSNWGPKRRN